MPKLNKRGQISGASETRLSRQNEKKELIQKRETLLDEILQESSSISLNDTSNQISPRLALDSHSRLINLLEELKLVESDFNFELPSRNNEKWKKFFEWINNETKRNQPIEDQIDKTDFEAKLDIKPSTNFTNNNNESPRNGQLTEEYSLVAKTSFNRGEKIFSIFRSCMLSCETALKDDELGDFIRNDSIASAMPNVVLVLHLLNEHSKGQKSYWCDYINILPSKLLPVLEMDKTKWKKLLTSAHIFDCLKMVRSISRQYTYFYKQLQSTNLPLKKRITFQYYCWGVSIVCSRQNEIPPFDRSWFPLPVVNALIPILDMCNHDHESNQAIFENDRSVLIAPRDLKAGDEIKINYGIRTSGEFYIHNGFVPDTVPSDMVPINLILSPQHHQSDLRVRLLKTLNMPNFGRFKLVANIERMRHKRDPHLTMFLIVYLLPEQDLNYILESENPVGVSDELYEYVQYKSYMKSQKAESNQSIGQQDKQESSIEQLGDKLSRLIEQYSSKRASIATSLIDRVLGSDDIEPYFAKLLEHEKAIYTTYIMT